MSPYIWFCFSFPSHTHTHTHHQRKEKQHQTCIPSGAAALCPRGTGLGRAAALKATKSVCPQHDAHSCAGCYSSMSCSYLAITTSASAFRWFALAQMQLHSNDYLLLDLGCTVQRFPVLESTKQVGGGGGGRSPMCDLGGWRQVQAHPSP